jgi:hypothetical protein
MREKAAIASETKTRKRKCPRWQQSENIDCRENFSIMPGSEKNAHRIPLIIQFLEVPCRYSKRTT